MTRTILTSDDILRHGLALMDVPPAVQAGRSKANNYEVFRAHYGAGPTSVAAMWDDLCTTDIEKSKLGDKEKGQKGLTYLFMALFFLFTYPKNRYLMATRFCKCDKYTSGKQLWTWVSRVAGLAGKVIRFPPECKTNGDEFLIAVDCRDHKIWEVKHPEFNLDSGYGSQKLGMHSALKYELAVATFHDQIVWINGPFKATRHDITIFRHDGLKQKLQQDYPDGLVVCDLGYRTSEPDEGMLAFPNSKDPPALKKFKSLCRCREEDINARMSKFMILSREFTHGKKKHKECFAACAVIIQYQLNNGDAFLTKM